MRIFNQFGLWYLATLAPAVGIYFLAWNLRPIDPSWSMVVGLVVALGALPIIAMVMISAAIAFRVETLDFLPRWYRACFEIR